MTVNGPPPLIPELGCSDFKTSLTFYIDVMGFNIVYQRAEEGFAMLERQGAHLMIDEIGIGRSWGSGAMEKPYGRGINIQMKTTAADELYARVRDFGALIFLPMEEQWYRRDGELLGNRQFIVQDPDGYLLRFYQDLGTKPA